MHRVHTLRPVVLALGLAGVLGALLVPGLASAAAPVLDFTREGSMVAGTYRTVHRVALALVPVLVLSGLIVEWLRGSPTVPPDYGAFLRRALCLIVLLSVYPSVFGAVLRHTDAIARRVTPREATRTFGEKSEAAFLAMEKRRDVEGRSLSFTEGFGTYLTNSLLHLVVLLAEGLYHAFGLLAQVVLALLYTIGPLMLAAGILPVSRTAGTWFKFLVSVAVWPIVSGILLSIATEAGIHAMLVSEEAWRSVAGSIVLGACVLLTPWLTGQLVVAGLGNLAGLAAGQLPSTLQLARAYAGGAGGALGAARAGVARVAGAARRMTGR